MKSTVETLSPTRVKLAIEVPFDELKPSLQKAYREIGTQIQIPGFPAHARQLTESTPGSAHRPPRLDLPSGDSNARA